MERVSIDALVIRSLAVVIWQAEILCEGQAVILLPGGSHLSACFFVSFTDVFQLCRHMIDGFQKGLACGLVNTIQGETLVFGFFCSRSPRGSAG